MKTVTGRITLIQEQRFRLQTTGGQNFLLTLAHDAPIEATDLSQWHDEDARVVVEYTGEPGLLSGVARRVRAETQA